MNEKLTEPIHPLTVGLSPQSADALPVARNPRPKNYPTYEKWGKAVNREKQHYGVFRGHDLCEQTMREGYAEGLDPIAFLNCLVIDCC